MSARQVPAGVRVTYVTPEEFERMLVRTGWTRAMLDQLVHTLPDACPMCGARWACVHMSLWPEKES